MSDKPNSPIFFLPQLYWFYFGVFCCCVVILRWCVFSSRGCCWKAFSNVVRVHWKDMSAELFLFFPLRNCLFLDLIATFPFCRIVMLFFFYHYHRSVSKQCFLSAKEAIFLLQVIGLLSLVYKQVPKVLIWHGVQS